MTIQVNIAKAKATLSDLVARADGHGGLRDDHRARIRGRGQFARGGMDERQVGITVAAP